VTGSRCLGPRFGKAQFICSAVDDVNHLLTSVGFAT